MLGFRLLLSARKNMAVSSSLAATSRCACHVSFVDDAIFHSSLSNILTCRCWSKVRLYNQAMEKVNLDGDTNQLAPTSELAIISSKQYLFVLDSYDCIYCYVLLTIMILRAIFSLGQ
jgi:hypothetical protein